MNGVQQFHALGHRALEGFAARDETGAACALVDHSRRSRLAKVVLTGCAAAVDETDAAHVAVRHLIAAQINRMVAVQFAIDALVVLAIRNAVRVQCNEAAVVLRKFLLDDIRFHRYAEMICLSGQIGRTHDNPCPS